MSRTFNGKEKYDINHMEILGQKSDICEDIKGR